LFNNLILIAAAYFIYTRPYLIILFIFVYIIVRSFKAMSKPKSSEKQLQSLMDKIKHLESKLAKPQPAKSQGSGKHKPEKDYRVGNIPQNPRQMGTAVVLRLPQVGIPNMKDQCFSYVAGSIYVGNGTLGATDKVYFSPDAGTHTQTGAPFTPIAPASTDFGSAYILAIEKLFRRKTYKRLRVFFFPIQSSTTNNMTITVAPIAGPADYAEATNVALSTDTTATPATQLMVMSFSGNTTVDSFEPTMIDLTQYIRGGAGAKENEFAIGNVSAGVNTTGGNQLGAIPACFVVSGNSNATALRGTNTHLVVVEEIVDLIDFTGNDAVTNPIGFSVCKQLPNSFKPETRTLALAGKSPQEAKQVASIIVDQDDDDDEKDHPIVVTPQSQMPRSISDVQTMFSALSLKRNPK